MYLGLVSYGTYLWHWPVILIAKRVADPNPAQLVIVTALVATGLASLSYQILERPIRISATFNRIPRVVVAVGLVTSVVCALLIVPVVVRGRTHRPEVSVAGSGSGSVPGPEAIAQVQKAAIAFAPPCAGLEPSRCTHVRGSGEHWLFIGDSNAEMMIPVMTYIAEKHDLTLSLAVTAGCPWQQDLVGTIDTEACRVGKADVYARIIPALRPDVVVVMNSARETEVSGGALDEMLRASRRTITTLRDLGARVIILEPMPMRPELQNPLTCLSEARVLEACRFVVSDQPTSLERLYREIDLRSTDVTSVDLDRFACPYLPICDPVIDGTIVRWDQRHLSLAYVQKIAPDVDRYFTDNRLVR